MSPRQYNDVTVISKEMALMNLGMRLKLEREACGLTQGAVAAIGGIQPNTQLLYESGMRCPRADYLSRLSATAIDVLFVVTGKRTPCTVAKRSVNEYALIKFLRAAEFSDKHAVEHIINRLAVTLRSKSHD
ncbi:helix-turn-helix domain-containing protein [Pseudomonas sp. UMAB-08]|uniref:helix-turn-helix domain-containing protein n=1 Tax=Pseudomonas sp. UMAB-08 TaxID=1365375 RepID=UPI001C570CFB|nr:helix-turn-helix transcriptional regulator [Pseudomonas sp. UMAB-08]